MLKRFSIFVAALAIAVVPAFAEVNEKQFETQMEKFLTSDKGQDLVGKAMEGYVKKRQDEARKKQDEMMAAQLESQFKNPVKIEAGNSPAKGPANAKVTVIEFSDFECPFCKKGKDTMDELLKAYPNDVKVVFKNLPLPMHRNATPAAKAALAAHKQGKFWEFHDALFDNQSGLGDAFYAETAKKLGLDVEKFKKDMADPALDQQIKDDMALAEKHDIRGTPGFFVNGVAVKGAYPISYFKQIVDRHLGKAPAKS